MDSSRPQTKKKKAMPSLFPVFPEALHRPEQSQCTKFNSELMKKIVCEKRRNNDKFQDGKCMHDVFKYYPSRHDPNSSSAIKNNNNSAVSPAIMASPQPQDKKE